MPELDTVAVLHQGLLVALKLCAPLLLAALAAGLLVAMLQAVTQISDSTLSFLPKLVATGLAAAIAGPFMATSLADYARSLIDRMIAVGGQ